MYTFYICIHIYLYINGSVTWVELLRLIVEGTFVATLCSIFLRQLIWPYLNVCLCVLEFHVLVKLSFREQVEQHQVTNHRGLKRKKRKGLHSFSGSKTKEDNNDRVKYMMNNVPLQRYPLQILWLSGLGLYQIFLPVKVSQKKKNKSKFYQVMWFENRNLWLTSDWTMMSILIPNTFRRVLFLILSST